MDADETAKRRVKKLQKLIAGPKDKRADGITQEDRNVLVKFNKRMARERRANNRCGWKHHRNILDALFDLAVETDALAASLEDGPEGRHAVDQLTGWVHENHDEGYTIQMYLSAIRVFGADLLDIDIEKETLPERFGEIEPSAHVTDDRAPQIGEIVEYHHLLQLVEATPHVRDRALISTEWDGGPRPMEEMYPLQYKNVKIEEDHILVTLPRTNGKSESRKLVISVGFPHLKKWIEEEHPVHDDPDDSLGPETYIWTKLNKNELLTYGGFADRFTTAGEEADLDRNSSAQNLRRSSASILSRQPEIGERDLRYTYDWAFTSPAPRHYIERFGSPVQANIVQARGHEIEDFEQEPDTAPVPCKACGAWTMRGLNECVACETDRDPDQTTFKTSRKIRHPLGGDKTLAKKILDREVTARDLAGVEKVADDIRGMGDRFFDQLPELKQKAEALHSIDDDPENEQFVTGVAGAAATGAAAVSEATADIVSGWHQALTLSPKYQDYPMNRRQQLMYSAGVTVWLGVIAIMLTTTGHTDAFAAGNPLNWAGLVFGLVAGFALVHKDIPSVEEAIAQQG